MPKYQPGDIRCATLSRDDGRFQGQVFVKGSIFDGREEISYLCPELDETKEDAMRRAISYVKNNFPPE